jgi:hypothetical protein
LRPLSLELVGPALELRQSPNSALKSVPWVVTLAMPDSTGDEQTSLPVYETRPTVQNAALVGLQGGGVGVLVASVQNALEHHNRGAMGILTRSGGTIGFFGQHFTGLFCCLRVC